MLYEILLILEQNAYNTILKKNDLNATYLKKINIIIFVIFVKDKTLTIISETKLHFLVYLLNKLYAVFEFD